MLKLTSTTVIRQKTFKTIFKNQRLQFIAKLRRRPWIDSATFSFKTQRFPQSWNIMADGLLPAPNAVSNAFGRICVSVRVPAMFVHALTFESLGRETSFLVQMYVFGISMSRSSTKVIRLRSRSQEQKCHTSVTIRFVCLRWKGNLVFFSVHVWSRGCLILFLITVTLWLQ